MFRKLRILVLLLVLLHVGVGAWMMRVRTTSWDLPVRVAVFPVAADRSEHTAAYVAGLRRETFEGLEKFFAEEGRRFGLKLVNPVYVQLEPALGTLPPPPPFGGSRLDVALWSLQLRWWVWRHAEAGGPAPHIRLFLLYHDPRLGLSVPHSVGLQKGLIGVVHVFATPSQAAENDVVVVHELLHTLGATDKYDSGTNQPRYPEGYAEPERVPREPQDFAEIMAGRIPVSPARADMPAGLGHVLIGAATALEIGWRRE